MNNDYEHHQHDENCQCESHDNLEHQHHPHKLKPITITTHDMSIVGSFKFSIDRPYEQALTILDHLLKQVATEVTAIGGIIGHIKAILASQGQSCMISITDDDSNKKFIETSTCTVEGVAIVFCIEPNQLENILEKSLENYINE